MKNFIKENLVLVIGLSLPILLIVLFLLATIVPKSLGTPPQHALLFTTVKYEYENPRLYFVDFKVVNHQLVAKIRKIDDNNKNYNVKKLMSYDAKTETVQEIAIDLDKLAEAGEGVEILVNETKHLTIDTSAISPDGYKLDGPNYRDNGLVGGLFGGGYQSAGYRIKKGAVAYKIETSKANSYYNDFAFIGWVTGQ